MDFYITAINTLKHKLSKQEKLAFISALLAGFLSHGYALSNNYIYHDATILNGLGSTFEIGRWFLGLIGSVNDSLFGNYSLPFLTVVLSIFIIAVSAIFVVKTLGIKTSFLSIFTGTIMAVYPVVTSTFAYSFSAVYYFVALLLGVYSIYYISDKKAVKDYVIAALLLMLSAGLYQAYFPVAATLALSVILKDILEGKEETKTIVNKGLRYVISLLSGMAAYLIVNKIAMLVTKRQATGYQGADSVGKLEIGKIPGRLIQAYLHFFYVKWNGINSQKCMWLFIGIFLGLAVLLILPKLFRKELTLANKIIFIVLVMIFPLAVNLVYLMSTSDTFSVHTLMRYPTLFVFLTPAVLIEDNEKILGKIAALLLTIIPLAYIYSNNVGYLKMNLVQEEITAYFAVLESRITSTEGYYDEMPVVFYGASKVEDKALTDMKDIYPDVQILGYEYSAQDLINVESWQRYMKYHTGYSPVLMDMSDTIANSQEFRDMGVYPDAGSIRIIDGAMVVKLGEY